MLLLILEIFATFVSVSADDFSDHNMVTIQNRNTLKYFGYDVNFGAEARDTPFFFKVRSWDVTLYGFWTTRYYDFSPFFQRASDGVLASTDKKMELKKSGSQYRSALGAPLPYQLDLDAFAWSRIAFGDGYWQLRNKEFNSVCLGSNNIGDEDGFGAGLPCVNAGGTHPIDTHWIITVVAYGANNYNPITGDFTDCAVVDRRIWNLDDKMLTLQNDGTLKYLGWAKNGNLGEFDYPFFWKTDMTTSLAPDNNLHLQPYFETVTDGVLHPAGDDYLSFVYQSSTQKVFTSILDFDGLSWQWRAECIDSSSSSSVHSLAKILNNVGCLESHADDGGLSSYTDDSCNNNNANQKWRVTEIPISAWSIVTGNAPTATTNIVNNDDKNSKKLRLLSFSLWLQLFVIVVCAVVTAKMIVYAVKKCVVYYNDKTDKTRNKYMYDDIESTMSGTTTEDSSFETADSEAL